MSEGDPNRGKLRFADRLAVALGGWLVRLLASTWRYTVRNEEELQRMRAGGAPFIFSIWHGQLLPLIWHHRNQGVSILVSEHKDGELIARFAESIGYGTIRGSSTRGAAGALLGLVRALGEGKEVGITPDGPRGPACSYAPGAAVAASKAGALILPMAAHADRAWRLGSWDRFIIPQPFAKLTIAYGAAVRLPEDARAAAAQAPQLELAMNTAVGAAASRS
ncbi:MAG: lysophospholipid acyltransferase family protein [Gemmatimonadaceae bacterium]